MFPLQFLSQFVYFSYSSIGLFLPFHPSLLDTFWGEGKKRRVGRFPRREDRRLPTGERRSKLPLDRLSSEKVILFAASFGGDVGQCFVRKYPERVSHLILLNTGGPDKRLGKATKLGKPLVTLLPLSVVQFLIQQGVIKALSSDQKKRSSGKRSYAN